VTWRPSEHDRPFDRGGDVRAFLDARFGEVATFLRNVHE
jgi:hypothetical protein